MIVQTKKKMRLGPKEDSETWMGLEYIVEVEFRTKTIRWGEGREMAGFSNVFQATYSDLSYLIDGNTMS